METIKDLTFIIPIRIDSVQRIENLLCTLRHLSVLKSNVIIYEADKYCNHLLSRLLPRTKNIVYRFVEDYDPIFHRTKYINRMVAEAQTPFISVWDADVIVSMNDIKDCMEELRKGTCEIAFPYNGTCLDTTKELRDTFIEHPKLNTLTANKGSQSIMQGQNFVGGAFIANKTSYLNAGGENENFYGWGPEDGDRYVRWLVMGYKVFRSKGYMYHLWHPRNHNGTIRSEVQRRICQYNHLKDSYCLPSDLNQERIED